MTLFLAVVGGGQPRGSQEENPTERGREGHGDEMRGTQRLNRHDTDTKGWIVVEGAAQDAEAGARAS